MTTSDRFQVLLAPDLFQRNECVNLRWSGSDSVPELAAITVMGIAKLGDDRASLMWKCVRRACSMVEYGLPSYQPWFCASDCGVNNRMTQRRALWAGLASRGFTPTARRTPEKSMDIGDDLVCFYGAAELEHENIERLRPIVTPASRSFLSWMPSETVPDVDGLVTAGWRRGLSEPRELANLARVLASQRGVVFRLFGEFDDRETGVDCIMGRENYTIMSSPTIVSTGQC
jgi:hypothetical protein